MFTNLMASRPAKERRWRVWLLVALAHVLVIGAIVVIPMRSRRDEVVEIMHEPIILDDQLRTFSPLPDIEVKPPETKPAETKPAEPGQSSTPPGPARTR